MVELEDRVRAYAAAAVDDCRSDRIRAVTRFEAGNRHAVFRVSYSTDAGRTSELVVRASLRLGPEACAEATWEAAVIAAAHGVGAPRLYDVRCEGPWFEGPVMCLQFVPGEARDLTAAAPDDLAAMGALLRRVHDVPTDHLRELRPAPSTLDAYLVERHADIVAKVALLRDVPPALRSRVDGARALVEERMESARRTPSLAAGRSDALLHGDPGAGNVLWTPTPVLIDWEYARLGDPADEVGYLFGQLGCTTAQRQAFWRGYQASTIDGGDTFEDLVERVRTWEPLTLLGSALWWLDRWSAPIAATSDAGATRPATYYLDEAVRRLDRLDALLS